MSSFDILAKPYRWLEYITFGPYLWRARLTHIEALAKAKRVLLAGDGDGRFLAELHKRYPHLDLHYLDASPAMLAQAKRRCPQATFHQTTLPTNTLPKAQYDAIITHFFLDCFTPETLPHVIQNLATTATPEATWIISDFKPTKHLWGRLIIKALYFAFQSLTNLKANHLTPYEPHMQRAGFILNANRRYLSGLLASEIWRRTPQ
jgi:ubiquinone/menaquinone biosynthesis C-methylase UbiE